MSSTYENDINTAGTYDETADYAPYSSGYGQDPDEIIRANGMAEAMEMDALKSQVQEYVGQIARLEELYERNNELVDRLRDINEETTTKLGDIMRSAVERIEEHSNSVRDIDWDGMQQRMEHTVADTQQQLSGSILGTQDLILESVKQSQQKIENLVQQSDDFSHKENVRVYRNIQAATDQLLQKQTQDLRSELEPLKTTLTAPQKKKVPVLQIITIILVLADILLHLVDYLELPGVLPF